LQTCLPQAGSR